MSAANNHSIHKRANLALLGGCIAVAAGTIATKPALDAAPALAVLLVQVLASTVLLTALAAATNRIPHRREQLVLALPGFLHPGLSFIFLTLGLALIPVSLEGLLAASEAAVVALLSWPLLRERPSFRVIGAIGIGTVGLVLLTNGGLSGGNASLTGTAFVLAGVLCLALDTIAVRALLADAEPLTLTVVANWASLVPISAAIFMFSGAPSWSWLQDTGTLTLVVISGLLTHAVAAVLFNIALAQIPAARAAAIFPIISVMIAAGGIVVLDEHLGAMQLIGGAIIIASALAVSMEPANLSPWSRVSKEQS